MVHSGREAFRQEYEFVAAGVRCRRKQQRASSLSAGSRPLELRNRRRGRTEDIYPARLLSFVRIIRFKSQRQRPSDCSARVCFVYLTRTVLFEHSLRAHSIEHDLCRAQVRYGHAERSESSSFLFRRRRRRFFVNQRVCSLHIVFDYIACLR